MWQKATKLPGKASLAKPVFLIKNDNNRTSLVIQWLRHHTSTSGGLDSIPGPTCQATQLKSKKIIIIITRKGQKSRLNWQAPLTHHLYSLLFSRIHMRCLEVGPPYCHPQDRRHRLWWCRQKLEGALFLHFCKLVRPLDFFLSTILSYEKSKILLHYTIINWFLLLTVKHNPS